MKIKLLPKGDLCKADCLQQSILNPRKRKRYRTFGYIKKQYAKNPKLFIGCYDRDRLVGIIFGFVKKETVLLGEFAVDKTYRRRGIGKKMLVLFEVHAKATGKKRILLGSKEDAERFYLDRGYLPLLFVQIQHKKVPKDYRRKGYDIIKETNYPDAKRLFIRGEKCNPRLKGKAKKDFNAYDVIYLFKKEIK
ncbi:MAG: GNAT family N-acetyltransferase [archaeon]